MEWDTGYQIKISFRFREVFFLDGEIIYWSERRFVYERYSVTNRKSDEKICRQYD